MLPSSMCGSTTETVGFFACDVDTLAGWLGKALGPGWESRSPSFGSPQDLCASLRPGGDLRRHALIRLEGAWTAVLTDGPTGTDVGMLPSLAARELGIVALRATSTGPSTDSLPATILEVFDPEAEDPLRCRRSIAAADDGGRWVFEQFGSPFEFERVSTYALRRVRDRFTAEMLSDYLSALGVPAISQLGHRAVAMLEKT